MIKSDLLNELSILTHSQRQRRMVDVGRLSLTDLDVQKVLGEMALGDFTERGLALQACYGSRDGELVLRSLTDPSRLLRGLALTLVAEVCDDDQVRRAIDLVPNTTSQNRLLRRISRKRRWGIIDAWLTRLLASGNRLAGLMLSYGSPAFVKQQLELAVEQGVSNSNWYRLAQSHTDVAISVLTRRAEVVRQLDANLVHLIELMLTPISDRRPDAALELVRLLTRHMSLEELPIQRLIERRPEQMADLVLESVENVKGDFSKVASRLDETRLTLLLTRRPQLLPVAEAWFRKLAPSLRLSLFQKLQGIRDRDGCVPVWLVKLLPGEERRKEARAHWHHPPLAIRLRQRYAACLDWDEARAVLDPFIRNPDADLRATANIELVGCIRFQRDKTAELLEFVLARKNEQDPVRCAILTAMSELPPGVWQAEHLDALGQVLRQALDATDLSHITAAAAQQLVVTLIPKHPEWAVGWLATLVKERGQVALGQLEDRLTDSDVRRIAPFLLPVLQAWNQRERQHQLIQAATSFGRRLRVFPEFVKILEDVTVNGTGSVSAHALMRLKEHCPTAFRELVPKLLKQDPSWITQQDVYQHVHRWRQDLLTPFLGRQAYRGRFSTGKTRFVLPVDRGLFRWWPTQRAEFAKTLDDVTRDTARDNPALLRVISQLAALLDVPAATQRLIQLADARNPKLMTRDAALRALGRLDANEGVQTLIDALNDDRSRIAIYALRSALLDQSPASTLELLRAVPLEKVTVAKEVVRLIGELKTADAFHELVEWDGRELHRDIRVALLRAFWDFLDQEQTWPVLERAALNADPAIAKSVSRVPADGLSPVNQQRLAKLMSVLLKHPDPRVRCDALTRCESMPVSDIERVLLPRLLGALISPVEDEVQLAASAVFSTYVGRDASAIETTFQELLPHRKPLDTTLQALHAKLIADRLHMRPTLDAVLFQLSNDPVCLNWRVRLAIGGLRGSELATYLEGIVNDLHPESLMIAVHELGSCGPSDLFFAGLGFDDFGETPVTSNEELQVLEARLSVHPDERLRRIAFAALVVQSRASTRWTQELRERLDRYRADTSRLVAGAAAFTFPPQIPDHDFNQSPDQNPSTL